MIKKNAILLSLAVILLPLLAQAQGLVIFDARDLFPKEAWNPPCKAVFTQAAGLSAKTMYTMVWSASRPPKSLYL